MPKLSDVLCCCFCCCRNKTPADHQEYTAVPTEDPDGIQEPRMSDGKPEGSDVYDADIPDTASDNPNLFS